MTTPALIVLIAATVLDCGLVFVAFRDFLKKEDKADTSAEGTEEKAK